MSNAILNSNQSSATVATIRQSTLVNPFAYTEKDRLLPPHSLQHLEVTKSGGSVGASQTVTFDLPKQGMLCHGLWLNMTMPAVNIADSDTITEGGEENAAGEPVTATTDAGGFSAEGLYGCIQSVRLETSGRIVESMSRSDILAKISDAPFGKRKAIETAARMAGDVDDNVVYQGIVYIPFYFGDDLRYAINTTFSEPHRLSVTFSDCKVHAVTASSATTYAAHVPTDCSALCMYRQLDDADLDATIQANMSDGLFSRLIRRSLSEATHTVSGTDIGAITPGPGVTKTAVIDLKETAAVSALYVQCKTPVYTLGSASAPALRQMAAPLRITHVKLTASGTTICDCPGDYLRFFGRFGEGQYGDGTPAMSYSNLENILKIDFGTGHAGHSNVISLRELSNPRLEVTFEPRHASQPVEIEVSYASETFLSEAASTGRVTLSVAS
jgi:hypothetical protein